jgi:hypothetical protein
MRYIPTLLFCALMPLGLVGQETPATPETSPTPTATPQEAALTLNPSAAAPSPASDRDFIKLPEASSPNDAAATKDTDVNLTGEVSSNSGESDAITDPNDLMPQDSPSQLPVDAAEFAAASEEQEIKVKIRYKETRLKVEKTPTLEALLAKAKSARNFESERAAYREYYRELFRRMKKLDPTLTKKCDAMETAYLSRLAQTRIEPTIPLEPPPKPSPLAN